MIMAGCYSATSASGSGDDVIGSRHVTEEINNNTMSFVPGQITITMMKFYQPSHQINLCNVFDIYR